MNRGILIALLGVALGGCAQAPVPKDHFYRLSVPADGSEPGDARLDGIVVVHRFLADGLISERSVVYTFAETPQELHQYNYHFWADPPTRMLQELSVGVLRRAALADEVVTSEFRVQAAWGLSGKIKRLEHLRGKSPRVVIEIEFGLNRERDGKLVWLRSYTAERPAADKSVLAAAGAMSNALGMIYSRLVADIRNIQEVK